MQWDGRTESISDFVAHLSGASAIASVDQVQSLWSGYGAIRRYHLTGAKLESVIVKHVEPPSQQLSQMNHPRGWSSKLSHQRKLKSYEVECHWYARYALRCDQYSRVPRCFFAGQADTAFLIVMEDLNSEGYSLRRSSLSFQEMLPCLQWLANFHARFLSCKPEGLWSTGTYWHLDTRPDELDALQDKPLKYAAEEIDRRLSACRYQTLVHGDAKLANFCFSEDSRKVSAVDFQYVGAGCGMKDVAYFIGSCLDEADCQYYEQALLKVYFEYLTRAIEARSIILKPAEVEREWRAMFALAWADFQRFVKGWSPGHWKINGYSERIVERVLAELKQ